MRIALTGNPNSGKTTMYNALTGRKEKIGNWAGVTVDRKESQVKGMYKEGEQELIAVDLPGAYSMSPFTSEESITSSYVRNEHPDVIVNIVDATNLSRSLFFTTQLLELGIPVVVALNKWDINEKRETKIDEVQLSKKLGCPVVKTISTSENGLKDVIKAATSIAGKEQKAPYSQGEINLHEKSEVEAADRKRFAFVNDLVKEVEVRKVLTKEKNFGDKIDAVITHPVVGIFVFAAVMFGVFYISQTTLGTWVADWLVGWIETFQEFVGGKLENANPLLYSLVVDGIIGGVGAVVGFLPLVMVMYFLIALLEDCGYMARATVVLDPIFKRVGLSGKTVIPLVLGTGCGIPAIMACRTIKNERERRTSAMLVTFMPCGAKLPVIALFAGAFFPDAVWVSPVMYFTGIALILFWALLVKAITGMKYRKSFFIIELPEYKIPSLKFASLSMLERGKAYIVKAGTIILVCNTAVQIMQSFSWSFKAVEADQSILASLSRPTAYLLVPVIGVVGWRFAAAAVTGFIAKENVVGTLATLFVGLAINEDLDYIGDGGVGTTVMGITKVAALAYLMFNLYTPPCFAALGALRSELQSAKWMLGAIALQFATGFTVGFGVFQIGSLIVGDGLQKGFVGGLVTVLVFVATVVVLVVRGNRKIDEEYQLNQKQDTKKVA